MVAEAPDEDLLRITIAVAVVAVVVVAAAAIFVAAVVEDADLKGSAVVYFGLLDSVTG